MDLNWSKVAEPLIVFFVGGTISFVVKWALKMSKDIDSAFFKIRSLEQKLKESGQWNPPNPGQVKPCGRDCSSQ